MGQARGFEELDERELNELGNAYSGHSMWEEAIDSYLRSMALRKALGDVRGQGIVLNNLGTVYYNQGRSHEALECYEGSRQIAQELGQDLSELVALMNLAFLHFTHEEVREFYERADEAERLALTLERWEPLSKLSWLRGRLALSSAETYEQGLGHYAEALRYAALEGETYLQEMMTRVDEQAERLLAQDSRGLALVLYDYLQAFMREQDFSEELLTYLGGKREEVLRRPSLT
jgi:tetratricopeptide (TPR) repeat protein